MPDNEVNVPSSARGIQRRDAAGGGVGHGSGKIRGGVFTGVDELCGVGMEGVELCLLFADQ